MEKASERWKGLPKCAMRPVPTRARGGMNRKNPITKTHFEMGSPPLCQDFVETALAQKEFCFGGSGVVGSPGVRRSY